VQQAFLDHFSLQCSYCTPGFVNAGTALLERLERTPVSRDRIEDVVLEALDGNICRCTGYVRYLTALRDLILATPGLTSDGEPS
jgi:aerobic-type carbon monoxide dehydrogenase small subunit (CoxS/CutS family)